MLVKATRIGVTGLWVVGLLLLLPTWGQASHERFGVYENWAGGSMRADRWLGFEQFGGQEVRREVSGTSLHMRFRRQGGTSSDVGWTNPPFTSNGLNLANPAAVDQLRVRFDVQSLTLSGCPANTTPSKARVAVIEIGRFNDGSSTGPGDRTGDYLGVLQAVRRSN
jgi:hypothetical protein